MLPVLGWIGKNQFVLTLRLYLILFRISISNFCDTSEERGGTVETKGESC